MSETIKIPGRIESVATGKVVTGANFILDDTKGKKQNVINEETDAELLRLDQEKQGNLTFDQTPTEDSTNPVTSGGVYAADQMLSQAIEAILLLIPSAASELNKLVDLATMNSSISTATASFKGTYNLVSDLHLTVSATHAQIAAALDALSLGADNNDYAFVQVPNTDTAPTDIAKTERYKFNGDNWAYEYDLNNSGFTTAQWNAINSGITTLLVAKLSALPTNEALTLALAGKQDNLTFDNAPKAGSNNPVKSGGIYTRNNEIVALINALDAAKQNVLTFDTTPTNGSTNPVTSNGVYLAIQLVQTAVVALDGRMGTAETKISTAEGNIVNLQAAFAALTQSDIVVVEGVLPSSGQQQNIIYRQPDQDHTPPQFYSDYMWNGTAWVLMATYNNAIDQRPKKGSQNLVTSGGVFDNMGALDVSELNATENPHTLKPYAKLDDALADIPSDYQKGGMSIKFVRTSDNKYVQYRLMKNTWSVTKSDWQGVDSEPTVGSHNLVESSGVNVITNYYKGVISDVSFDPGTPTHKVFYITSTPGVYTHFNNIKIYQGEISVLQWDRQFWTRQIIAKLNGAMFLGVVTPTYDPGTINWSSFFITAQAGTYTNFGNIIIPKGISVIRYNKFSQSWSTQLIIGIDDISPISESGKLITSGAVYNALDSLNSIFVDYIKTKSKKLNLLENKSISNVAGVGQIISLDVINNNGGQCYSSKVKKGDVFLIKSQGMYSYLSYAFTNENLEVLECSNRSELLLDKIIIAPDDGYIAANFNKSVEGYLYYSTYLQTPNAIDDIQKEIIVKDGYYNNNDILFTSSNVKVGEKMYYKLYANPNRLFDTGYIALYGTDDRVIRIYGKVYGEIMTDLVYDGEFIIPNNFSYAKFISSGSYALRIEYVERNIVQDLSDYRTTFKEVSEIEEIGTPIEIMQNGNQESLDYGLGFFQILQISDTLYYMYYDGYRNDKSVEVCFAYSTDCIHWTKELPNGITPIVSNTNRLFTEHVFSVSVIKVPDSNYPYRMFGTASGEDIISDFGCYMWKSADGIHWVNKKLIYDGFYDTQYAAVLRGNTIKVWGRIDGYINPVSEQHVFLRQIGFMYCDIDGNILCPPSVAFGNSLYNSAAMPLDERRELLMPTYFNPTDDKEDLEAYIVEGNRFQKINLPSNTLQGNNEEVYISPSMIVINGKKYIALFTRDTSHETYIPGTTVSKIWLAELRLKRDGLLIEEV